MPTERMRKLIDDKVSTWDKFKVAITPGDVSERSRKLEQLALDKVREEEQQAQLEAIRRKRMSAGG